MSYRNYICITQPTLRITNYQQWVSNFNVEVKFIKLESKSRKHYIFSLCIKKHTKLSDSLIPARVNSILYYSHDYILYQPTGVANLHIPKKLTFNPYAVLYHFYAQPLWQRVFLNRTSRAILYDHFCGRQKFE